MRKLIFIVLFLFSVNSFGQWEIISPAVNGLTHSYTDLQFVNSDTGFVVGTVEGLPAILRTLDAGITWDTTNTNLIGSGVDGAPYGIHFPTDSIGYVVCTWQIFKTDDYGENWYEIDTANTYENTLTSADVFFLNNDTGYVGWADGGSGCLKTFDGGLSWVQDDSLLGVRYFDSYSNSITACVGFWAMLDTQTLEWSLFDAPEMTSYNYKHAIYRNGRIIVVGSVNGASPEGVLAYSDDMGQNWNITIAPGSIRDIQFLNDNLGHIGGGFSGSIRTTDGGLSWYSTTIDDLGTGMQLGFRELFFVNDTLGYAISADGIYKTSNGGGSAGNLINFYNYDLGVSSYLNGKIHLFPNPAENQLYISFVNHQTQSDQLLEVHDLQGKLIDSWMGTSNENTYILDVSGYEAGTYILKLSSEEESVSRKFVVN